MAETYSKMVEMINFRLVCQLETRHKALVAIFAT